MPTPGLARAVPVFYVPRPIGSVLPCPIAPCFLSRHMARILIIDDDDLLRSTLKQALEHFGHSVREAADGIQGIAAYHAEPAELVITDIVMPEKEGLDIIRDLRRDYPGLRIIAMSGGLAYDPKLYLHMAERFGATAVLAKPFELTELRRIVDEALKA